MARITVEDCLEKIDSQYDLVLLAKERTSQLNAGNKPLVSEDNDKNTVIALREIGDGKISLKTLDLIEMFHEKDYKGELEKYDTKNSFSNRNPSLSEEGKKLYKLVKKLVYSIRVIGGQASFNWIPLGILPDVICLEAEDRGHQGTLLFSNWRTQWKKTTWKKVITILEEEYDCNEEVKAIIEEIQNLSSSYEKFSIEEVIPSDIKRYWLNYQHNIEFKVYSSREKEIAPAPARKDIGI